MKILLLADSRGMWPKDYTWHNAFNIKTNLQHEIHSMISGRDRWLLSLHMMEKFALEKMPVDLLCLQMGWHEGGACYWPENIWKDIIVSRWNPDALVNKIVHKGKEQFQYIDRKNEKELIEGLKKESKHCWFIGLPSLRPPNDLDTEYRMGMRHHYDGLKSNQVFSELVEDFLHLPMDSMWPGFFCSKDRIHFNENGANYVSDYMVRYVNRLEKTVHSCLAQSKNHQELFLKAKQYGTSIVEMTKDKDVVLLAKSTDEELLAQFLGCILYNRRPLIIQHPSNKVSSEEFRYKMQDIKDKINPALCICNPDDINMFREFFVSLHTVPASKKTYTLFAPSPYEIAFLQLSSGTTGDVKVIEVTHKHLIENCEEYSVIAGITHESAIASWLPLYHDMGLIASFLLPIVMDCQTYIIDTFTWLSNPVSILQLISERKATHCWMPNFAFSYMHRIIPEEQLKDIDLSSIKHFISCSEPTYFNDLLKFSSRFKVSMEKFSNCYALAENVFAVSQSNRIETVVKDGIQYVSCGRPICSNSVIIQDNGEDLTETGKIGHVMIKSSSQPKTNQVSNFYGYYDTGDLGFMIDGEIFIVARQKDSFVSFGNNVYPNIVEAELDKIDGLIDGRIACFGIIDTNVGSDYVCIVAETNNMNAANELKTKIQSKIKELFDLPSVVFIEPSGFIIKTSSGKISRSRTRLKIILYRKVLFLTNQFLASKSLPPVDVYDALYSSGLLDSLSLFELILYLEKNGIKLDTQSLTKDSVKMDIAQIDSISKIVIYYENSISSPPLYKG